MLTINKKLFAIALLSMTVMATMAQQMVKGVVRDDTGEALAGVYVYVDGKPVTTTDANGQFSLRDVTSQSNVRVTYLGYEEVTLQVGDKQNLEFVLRADDKSLEEVVVVGYGTMKKADLTGAVSSVGTMKLNEKGAVSVIANLQGSVPGVNITQSSGRTGGDFNIEIRGKNSISSSQTPLYVVDGITCSSIDFLNPQDIERIDVLKDASSTAIYGSRATAGVVVVTTKSGSNVGRAAMKPSITYDGYYGISNVARMPEFLDADEFYQYRFMKFLNVVNGDFNNGHPVWINDDLARCLLQDGPTGIYRMKELRESGKTYDWPSLVTQNGQQQNHYLAVSGSSAKTQYHIGVGYSQEKGVFKGDGQNKFNFKVSVDTEVLKWLNAGAKVNMGRISRDYASDSGVNAAFRNNPYMQPYDSNGNLTYKPGSKEVLNTDMYQFTSQINPLLYLEDETSNRLSWHALGNFYLEAKPLKGLSLKTTFSPQFSYYRYGYYQGTLTGESQNTAKRSTSQGFSYTWDNMITYDRLFGKEHHVNLMGLVSYNYGNSEGESLVYNKVLDGTYWWNLGSTDQGYNYDSSNTTYSENSLMSYALRANYTFKGRYMITGTIRWDGSSRFADGNRWGSFPSAAVAWRISEEPWMERTHSWLSNLKLRLSYGVTGNNSVSNYATRLSMSGTSYYPLGGTYSQAMTIDGMVDKNLKWEKSNEINLGLDFGFLNDRIRGSVDVYNKKSSDLLYKVQLPLEAGGTSVTTNIGSVRNKGVEVSLTTTNIRTSDWLWETTFTFAHNKNTVLEINGTGNYYSGSDRNNLFIGEPYSNIYGYVWDGIVSDRDMTVPDTEIARLKGFTPGQTVKEYEYYYQCYGLCEGNPIIVDKNGDGKFTDDDKQIYKSDPDWTGSITSNLSWKGIDFSFSIYAKQNYTIYSPFYAQYLALSDRGMSKLAMDWYIPAGTLISCDGQNADGTFINPVYQETTHYGSYPFPNNGCSNGGVGTSYWLGSTNSYVDGSFVKVKHITLGYSLPKKWLKAISCQNLRLYCTVTNPFVFTNYKGYDPEWASASLTSDGPSTVTWQFGANIKF